MIIFDYIIFKWIRIFVIQKFFNVNNIVKVLGKYNWNFIN